MYTVGVFQYFEKYRENTLQFCSAVRYSARKPAFLTGRHQFVLTGPFMHAELFSQLFRFTFYFVRTVLQEQRE